MVETSDGSPIEIPKVVNSLLDKFVDVMPPELTKTLPLKWVIDYKIELIPKSSIPTHTLYKISLLELKELKK